MVQRFKKAMITSGLILSLQVGAWIFTAKASLADDFLLSARGGSITLEKKDVAFAPYWINIKAKQKTEVYPTLHEALQRLATRYKLSVAEIGEKFPQSKKMLWQAIFVWNLGQDFEYCQKQIQRWNDLNQFLEKKMSRREEWVAYFKDLYENSSHQSIELISLKSLYDAIQTRWGFTDTTGTAVSTTTHHKPIDIEIWMDEIKQTREWKEGFYWVGEAFFRKLLNARNASIKCPDTHKKLSLAKKDLEKLALASE